MPCNHACMSTTHLLQPLLLHSLHHEHIAEVWGGKGVQGGVHTQDQPVCVGVWVCVCVCVRARVCCVCVCARARARMCVHAVSCK